MFRRRNHDFNETNTSPRVDLPLEATFLRINHRGQSLWMFDAANVITSATSRAKALRGRVLPSRMMLSEEQAMWRPIHLRRYTRFSTAIELSRTSGCLHFFVRAACSTRFA
ncbi:hypothetical protein BST61_g1502 [Cercospora zeina]